MKLIRYTHPLSSLREWDALFEDPFRAIAPLLSGPLGTLRGEPARRHESGVEWFEDDGHFHARIELPGVKRENLRLDAEDGLLRLSFAPADRPESQALRDSRAEYVIRCPEGGRHDGVEARLADGILEVSLPKVEARKPVNVEIR